jgi:hypothetical protein
MTNAATNVVENAVANRIGSQRAPRYTEIDRRSETSPFQPSVWANTVDTKNAPQKGLNAARSRPTFETSQVQSIPGVVAEVRAETIVIQCDIAAQTVELNLPPALVPSELQVFGRTVSITLDYSSGYQRPLVEPREPAPAREQLPGEVDMNAWVSQL